MGIATIGLLIFSSLVFEQTEGEIYQVDILHDEQGWHIEPCPLTGSSGDTWRIRNFASDTVHVRILIMVDRKNALFFIYTLAPMDSTDHPIGQWGCGIVAFLGACPRRWLSPYDVWASVWPCFDSIGNYCLSYVVDWHHSLYFDWKKKWDRLTTIEQDQLRSLHLPMN